jgi:hypothetical protein
MSAAKLYGGVSAEPVSYMTLYVGALVVWAIVKFGQMECGTNLEHHNGRRNVDNEWVKTGGKANLFGLPLCGCMVDSLVKRFAAFIPAGATGWGGDISKLI